MGLMCCSDLLLFANRSLKQSIWRHSLLLACEETTAELTETFLKKHLQRKWRERFLVDIISVYFSPEREMLMKETKHLIRLKI